MAGTFFQAQANIKMIGKAAQKETEKFWRRLLSTAAMPAKEVALLLWPRKKKKSKKHRFPESGRMPWQTGFGRIWPYIAEKP